jgi:hypothetical protein
VRELTDHIVEGDVPQNQLRIEVTDEPGAGGANHIYEIKGARFPDVRCPTTIIIPFQNGPIKETGLNGITQEVLLAIVIDRLRSFQVGPFPCVENQTALWHCQVALESLKFRTENRIKRGVEGETKP